MNSVRTCIFICAALVASTPCTVALAQHAGNMRSAADAYRRGQRAQLAGEHARAARFFELANEFVPSPPALRSAIRNYRAAGNEAAAAQLAAEALRQEDIDDTTRRLADRTLAELGPQLGRLNIVCAPACGLVIDGSAVSTEQRVRHDVFVTPAEHSIIASWSEERVERRDHFSEAGESHELRFEAPPMPEPDVEPEAAAGPGVSTGPGSTGDVVEGGGGLSPAFFFVGLGLSLGGGAIYVWSLLDTLDQRDVYVAAPTEQGYDEGVAAELRTIIIGSVSAAFAVGTLALAIFGTDWSFGGDSEDSETVAGFWVSPSGGGFTLRHAFSGGPI